MADLSGKTVVVTGADQGLGPGLAAGLAEAGATLYLAGASESFEDPPAAGTLQATAQQVTALGGEAVAVRLDQQREREVALLMERIGDERGRLDALVNHAAAPMDWPDGPFWEQPPEAWDDYWAASVRACYVAAVLAAPLMVARGSGLLVNLCGTSGADEALHVADATAAAALEHMARHMARGLTPHGVAAVALWPGRVNSDPVTGMVGGGRLREGPGSSSRFVGRCLAALAMDPDILEKAGGAYRVADLALEYRFSEPGD